MKVKLTKRSKTDKTLVTMSTAPLSHFFFLGSCVGDKVKVIIEGVETIWTLVRPNKNGHPTAMTTHALPRFIRLPRVGRPVYAEVTEAF